MARQGAEANALQMLREDREQWWIGGRLAGEGNHESAVISHDFPTEIFRGGGHKWALLWVLKFKEMPMKMQKLSQIKPNKAEGICDVGLAHYKAHTEDAETMEVLEGNLVCRRNLLAACERWLQSKAAWRCASRRTPKSRWVCESSNAIWSRMEIFDLRFEKRPMKTRKLSQIKPNKAEGICDLRIAINTAEVRSKLADGLNDFVRAKAALKRPHSKRFARGGNSLQDVGITEASMPQSARSATLSTFVGQAHRYRFTPVYTALNRFKPI